jgi:multidrug efflux pump subunit AcrA (membrane-fusion protein)
MAQAESRFETAKRRYEMELAKREELERQLKACVIRAVQPGLVAYGPINSGIRYNEPIEEGAAVRLRQTILTIPDMEGMGVHVSVHESQVKKVKIGQRVRVRVDAEPGKELYGQVAELAVLPDSTSSRYTPNLKVYPCSVHIDGAHDWLKPGMNAKVEIIVSDLADVLYVPVQAIEVENDRHFCYVNGSGELERREVATGSFNDDFIQVLKGLQPGENVALTIPKRSVLEESMDTPGAAKSAKPDKGDKKAKKAVAAAL